MFPGAVVVSDNLIFSAIGVYLDAGGASLPWTGFAFSVPSAFRRVVCVKA